MFCPTSDNCWNHPWLQHYCKREYRKQPDGNKQFFENILGKAWTTFCLGEGQNPVLWDNWGSDSQSFCHSHNQHTAGRADRVLVGIHWVPLSSIAPALGPTDLSCPIRCQEPRHCSLWLLLTVQAMPSGWGKQWSSLLSEESRLVQAEWDTAQCCQSSVKWLLCHLELGRTFLSPFYPRVFWIIQLLSATSRWAAKSWHRYPGFTALYLVKAFL